MFFYNKCSEKLEKIAQIGGGCFIPGDIQDQDGPGTGQSNITLDVHIHFRDDGLDNLSTQMIL